MYRHATARRIHKRRSEEMMTWAQRYPTAPAGKEKPRKAKPKGFNEREALRREVRRLESELARLSRRGISQRRLTPLIERLFVIKHSPGARVSHA